MRSSWDDRRRAFRTLPPHSRLQNVCDAFIPVNASSTHHNVFSAEYPIPLIRKEIRERLYEHVGGKIRTLNGHLMEIGGIGDHVHLPGNLCR